MFVGCALGLEDGTSDGCTLGSCEVDGLLVGCVLGLSEGADDGDDEGLPVGCELGDDEGLDDGDFVGLLVGGARYTQIGTRRPCAALGKTHALISRSSNKEDLMTLIFDLQIDCVVGLLH